LVSKGPKSMLMHDETSDLGGAAEVGGHAVRGLDRGVAGRSTILMLPPHARDVLHHELLFNYPIAFLLSLVHIQCFLFLCTA
jgi:hypothetical protein